MKTKKTYNAPLVSIVKIETKDVIMASAALTKADFFGKTIESKKVYLDIQ